MVKYRFAGIGGSSRLLPGSSIGRASAEGLDPLLQLLAGPEGDHGPGGDRDLLAGLGVAARALVLAAEVEIAETGQLDLAPLFLSLIHI